MKKKAAIYARFSSDLQRDRSIDDQIDLCRAYADRSGFEVVAEFRDRARSGASVFGRDGLMSMMEQARDRAHPFDVIIVEELDRLSRDQEDLAGLYKRLSFADVAVMAVHNGQADQIQVGIRGIVGALFLQDLAQKVRRGMAGVVRDGRHAGGRAYGYRPVLGRPGELEIVEEEREIILRIFSEFVAGKSPRDTASGLNRDHVPPPRGPFWRPSALYGSRQRGHGILQNPLYAGVLVWNRVRMVKDPETGRRVSRVNPESEWQRSAVPHLAIIDTELFAAAQRRVRLPPAIPAAMNRKPRHMLSGLLKCGVCGAGLAVKDTDHGRVRIMCVQAKEVRTCSNRRPYYLDTIEQALVREFQVRLGNRTAIELYIRNYNAERRRLAKDAFKDRSRLEARLTAAKGELTRTVGLLIRGVIQEEDAEGLLPDLRAKVAEAEQELARSERPPNVVALHPRAVDEFLATVDNLGAAISSGTAISGEAAKTLRELVDTVTISPPQPGEELAIVVTGRLSSLLGPDAFPAGQVRGGKMVAGEGLEPPTPGL